MKKNNIFYACAAAALVFASCQKEAPAPEMPQADGMNVITATTLSTKTTTQDGVNVLWENGDQIGLFALVPTDNPDKPNADFVTYTTTLEAPSATATFLKDEASTIEPTQSNGKYNAFYAKGAAMVTKSRNLNAVYAINKEQVAKNGGDFASSIMYGTSENTNFQFSHIVSYVKFTVDQNTTPFNKLTISSADESQYVVTRIQVDFASDPTVTLLPTNPSNGNVYTQSSKTVSVTTDDAANFAPGTYYMAINADTYAQGLNLTFSNGTADYTITTPTNVEMKAGAVANLGTIGTLAFVEDEKPKLEVGTVYAENGVNQGVVYWIDPDNPYKGKAVSVSSAEAMDWSEGTIWKAKIDSQEDGLANYNQFNSSDVYTSQKEKYYALQYCENLRETLGGNWYLPAPKEIRTLFQVYYGLSAIPEKNGEDYRLVGGELSSSAMSTKEKFDSALILLGETKTATLDGDANADGSCGDDGYGDEKGVTYWSSKVNTGGAIQYVNIGIYNLNNTNKVAVKGYVRCVRDVVLQ